ncbi:MAG TPA: diguanylate cyclase [Candidatus Hydrogenedentes bacterium]|nr:diguanylate cyclase [Candidatus Hydrogenedentota bacterium]
MKWLNASLRTQVVTIVCGIVSIFLVMTLVLGWQTHRSFSALERDNVTLYLKQVQSAFHREIARLESLTADWAPWDDTVRFVEGQYSDFIEVNLPDDLYTGIKVNVFIITDSDGNIKYAKNFDLDKEEIVELPGEVFSLVGKGGRFSQFRDERDCVSGIYVFPDRVLLAASRPIVTTSYEGPIRGTLLAGVWLDDHLVEGLRDITELAFTVERQDQPDAAGRSVPPLRSGDPPRITPLSMDEIRGEALLADMENRDALVVTLTLPRDVYRQGMYLYMWFLVVGTISALAVILLLAWFMRRRVLERLDRFERAIQRIEESRDFTLRAPESRYHDEMGRIVGQFNRMMERLQEQELAICEKEALLSGVLRTAADGIILIDEKGKIIEYNGSAAVIFGYAPEEAIGKSVGILMPEPHSRQHDQYIRKYLETGEAQIIGSTREVLGRRKDGTIFPMTLAVSEVKRPGKPPVFAGIVRDITEHKRNEELLRHAATHDGLTQLLNRRRFEERLSVEVHSAHRYGHALSLAMIDIDYFKQINDTYGHQAGDAVLMAIARIIREDIRLDDFAGRYGGDELCVGFPHTPSISAVNCVERIRSRVKDLAFNAENGQRFKVTLSIGIAQLTFEHKDTRMLFIAADEALYEAKKNGRDQVVTR